MAGVRNRIKVARVERGFTQQELAEKIGVTRQTVGLIEIGKIFLIANRVTRTRERFLV